MADCGGGTVDLTVHQIEKPQGTLKELYKASGGLRIPIHPFFPGTPKPGWDPPSPTTGLWLHLVAAGGKCRGPGWDRRTGSKKGQEWILGTRWDKEHWGAV